MRREVLEMSEESEREITVEITTIESERLVRPQKGD
jgi:hypothetical protein